MCVCVCVCSFPLRSFRVPQTQIFTLEADPLLAQWLRRSAPNLVVMGSNPAAVISHAHLLLCNFCQAKAGILFFPICSFFGGSLLHPLFLHSASRATFGVETLQCERLPFSHLSSCPPKFLQTFCTQKGITSRARSTHLGDIVWWPMPPPPARPNNTYLLPLLVSPLCWWGGGGVEVLGVRSWSAAPSLRV